MQTTTVSRDATGLPAFISTPAKRRRKAPSRFGIAEVPTPTTSPGMRSVSPFARSWVRAAIGCSGAPNALPAAFRADLSEPSRVAAVFVYGLPDEPGYMAYTKDGATIVTEDWIGNSVEARPVHARPVAAKLRAELGVSISTRLRLNTETRHVARVRRKMRSGRYAPAFLRPWLDIGRASALTSAAPDPKAAAMLLASTFYGVTVGELASAFDIEWEEAHATLEAAKVRRLSGDTFAHQLEMAEDIARQDLESLGRLQGVNTPPELRAA